MRVILDRSRSCFDLKVLRFIEVNIFNNNSVRGMVLGFLFL